MGPRIILIALTFACAASTAGAAECLQDNEDGQIAEGTLSVGEFEDAAGRPERALILTLPVPACLDSDDPDGRVDSTTTIHVYSVDESVSASIEKHVGQSVQIRGTPFAAHTAHHHAPIVMDVTEIDAI